MSQEPRSYAFHGREEKDAEAENDKTLRSSGVSNDIPSSICNLSQSFTIACPRGAHHLPLPLGSTERHEDGSAP